MRLLLLDNYDSFTFNLCAYLKQLGAEVEVIRNDELKVNQLLELLFDGLVISPGPGTPQESGVLMELLSKWPMQKPILGVCLGFQALALADGAMLTKAPSPMHGKVSALQHSGKGLFEGIAQQTQVCRYHSLCIKDLPNLWLDEAYATDDLSLMAIRHTVLPRVGLQFHPEAILTTDGMKMLSNWMRLYF